MAVCGTRKHVKEKAAGSCFYKAEQIQSTEGQTEAPEIIRMAAF